MPRAIGEDSKRPQRVIAELAMAKVTRAIYSERQLQQVMDDFWFNHFNVFAREGRGPLLPDLLRTRRHSAAHAGEVQGFA